MITHEFSCSVSSSVALARICVRPRKHSSRLRQVSLVCIATGTVSARGKFCVPSHLRFTALAISSILSSVVSLTPDALRAVACCHLKAVLVSTPRVDCFLSPCGWVCSFACSWLCSFRCVHACTVLCEALVPLHPRCVRPCFQGLQGRRLAHRHCGRAPWPCSAVEATWADQANPLSAVTSRDV